MSTGSTGSTVDPEVVRWVRRVLPVGSLPLPEPDAGALVDVATVRRFAGGTVMVAGGRPPHEVYLVRSGSVELRSHLVSRSVTLSILGEGGVLADLPMLLGGTMPWDAVAYTDSTVLAIDAAALDRLLCRRPALARAWMLSVAERLVLAQRHQTDVLGGCLESRIAALLLRHPEDVLELSQETVARLVAVRRSSANQALQRMAARGDIRVAYRRIEVLDRPALRRLRDHG